jgi:luciferase family oxidoreductase group 1
LVRATPGEGLKIPIWLLGSSIFSVQLAAMLGLPFAFASHFPPTHLDRAIKIYREKFQSSDTLKEPYIIASVNVVAADTDKKTTRLFTSLPTRVHGMVRGTPISLQAPVDKIDNLWNAPEKYAVNSMLKYSFVGGSSIVKKGLLSFSNST